jgi:Polysaccharide biosynthesis C-terminal domain
MPAFFYAFRTIQISVLDWLKALLPALTACLAMGAVVTGLRAVLPPGWPLPLQLALVVAAGALAYIAVIWLGFRRRVLELWTLVRSPPASTVTSAAA